MIWKHLPYYWTFLKDIRQPVVKTIGNADIFYVDQMVKLRVIWDVMPLKRRQ